jgi:CheY-like chemotaxis protein
MMTARLTTTKDAFARQPIRILHLEDNILDAALVKRNLLVGALRCQIVLCTTKQEFESTLGTQSFDVILCDYSLPGYSGDAAIRLVQRTCPEIPVIVVSGALSEEQAADCLKDGAIDCLLKDHLERLVPAIEKALMAVQQRRRGEAGESLCELNA